MRKVGMRDQRGADTNCFRDTVGFFEIYASRVPGKPPLRGWGACPMASLKIERILTNSRCESSARDTLVLHILLPNCFQRVAVWKQKNRSA